MLQNKALITKLIYFFIDNILVGKNVISFQDLPRNKKLRKIREKLCLVQDTVKKQRIFYNSYIGNFCLLDYENNFLNFSINHKEKFT